MKIIKKIFKTIRRFFNFNIYFYIRNFKLLKQDIIYEENNLKYIYLEFKELIIELCIFIKFICNLIINIILIILVPFILIFRYKKAYKQQIRNANFIRKDKKCNLYKNYKFYKQNKPIK